MSDPRDFDPSRRPWPAEDPAADAATPTPDRTLPAAASPPLAAPQGGLTDRDRQMMEMAYATGRAQAMAEAAMHAANAAHMANYHRYNGPPTQTNVYVQQRPSSLAGCGAALIILTLIILGGFGFMFIPLNPVIGGCIVGISLLGLTVYIVMLLK